MIAVYLFQGDIRLAEFHRCHEAPVLTLCLQLLATLLKVCIKGRQLLPEVVDRAFEILVGNEEVFLDILLLHLIASLTSEDDQFAHHVSTAEVDAWVRFGIALFLGTSYRFREGNVGTDLVEDEVECSGEHRLDFQDLVA